MRLNDSLHPNKLFIFKRYVAGIALIITSLACSLSPRAAEAP
jgi:hypothetical protein